MTAKIVATAVLLLGIAFCWKVAEPASTPPAPAPTPECSGVIVNLADCLPFVTNDTATKPAGKCCDGLKVVLKTNPLCLCEVFKSSAHLGIRINITKALSLPSACHVSAPPITNCPLAPDSAPSPAPVSTPVSAPPAQAPAVTPTGPSPSSTASPPTSTGPGSTTNSSETPAPAPKASSSSTLALSKGLLVAGAMVSVFLILLS